MPVGERQSSTRWVALVAFATAQFVMVLDQSAMNVSISALVHDFDTTVTTIQAVITLYCLVMAMFMMAGAKIGDMIGRRRAFSVGLVIYGCGSALTAGSQSVAMLAIGWSLLEGLGAALVLPALAALIGGNFAGQARKVAYAVIGGVAGAGIAVGPILGGWATTQLTWRVVFAGEVVFVVFILAMTRFVSDTPQAGAEAATRRRGDCPVGRWAWQRSGARSPAVEYLGLDQAQELADRDLRSVADDVRRRARWGVALGIRPMGTPTRGDPGHDPLVHLDLVKIPTLRSGLVGLFSQNLILMGVFFVVPLYLQLVLGFDALKTGEKMLPVSVTMFLASAVGSRLSSRFVVRSIVRAGLVVVLVGNRHSARDDPAHPRRRGFFVGMAVLGVGMGLMVSQLGNVVQSSVDESGRSEAGGLQYTGQQLGSSLGVALIGAIVLAGLVGTFVSNVEAGQSYQSRGRCAGRCRSGLGHRSGARERGAAAAQHAGIDQATTRRSSKTTKAPSSSP